MPFQINPEHHKECLLLIYRDSGSIPESLFDCPSEMPEIACNRARVGAEASSVSPVRAARAVHRVLRRIVGYRVIHSLTGRGYAPAVCAQTRKDRLLVLYAAHGPGTQVMYGMAGPLRIECSQGPVRHVDVIPEGIGP